MKQSKELRTFVKNQCAFYDQECGVCQFTDIEHCRVLEGQQCGHFEQCVLAPQDWPHSIPGYLPRYDHQKILDQYADQTKTEQQRSTFGCFGLILSFLKLRRYILPSEADHSVPNPSR